MKKVLHVTTVHYYKDNRIFYRYCKSLVASGYQVLLFAPCNYDFNESGIDVIGLGPKKAMASRLIFALSKVFLKIVRCRPDIIHIHDPELLLLVPLLRILGYFVVYDVHEDKYYNILQKKSVIKILRFPVALLVSGVEWISSKYCCVIIAEKYYKYRFPNAVEVLNYPKNDYRQSFDEDIHALSFDLRKNLPSQFSSEYNWYIYSGNVTIERGALTQLQVLKEDSCAAVFYIGFCSLDVYKKIKEWLIDNHVSEARFVVVGIDEYVPQSVIDRYQKSYSWTAGLAIFPYDTFYASKELTKFFEYINAGIPILCSPFKAWSLFLEENRAGVVYDKGWQDRLLAFRLQKDVRIESSFKWEDQFDDLINKCYKNCR